MTCVRATVRAQNGAGVLRMSRSEVRSRAGDQLPVKGSGSPMSSSAALGGIKLGSRSGGAVTKTRLASIQSATVRGLRK